MQDTQEMRVWSLGGEDPLEEDMATHSSIRAWKIPWREEPGGQAAVHGVVKSGTGLIDWAYFLRNGRQGEKLWKSSRGCLFEKYICIYKKNLHLYECFPLYSRKKKVIRSIETLG